MKRVGEISPALRGACKRNILKMPTKASAKRFSFLRWWTNNLVRVKIFVPIMLLCPKGFNLPILHCWTSLLTRLSPDYTSHVASQPVPLLQEENNASLENLGEFLRGTARIEAKAMRWFTLTQHILDLAVQNIGLRQRDKGYKIAILSGRTLDHLLAQYPDVLMHKRVWRQLLWSRAFCCSGKITYDVIVVWWCVCCVWFIFCLFCFVF